MGEQSVAEFIRQHGVPCEGAPPAAPSRSRRPALLAKQRRPPTRSRQPFPESGARLASRTISFRPRGLVVLLGCSNRDVLGGVPASIENAEMPREPTRCQRQRTPRP